MRGRGACLTLLLQVAQLIPIPSRRKKLAGEPDFQRPPVWIHGIVAGILVQSKREAKRRALLKLLDRIPLSPPK
jgi:hypothetical protein